MNLFFLYILKQLESIANSHYRGSKRSVNADNTSNDELRRDIVQLEQQLQTEIAAEKKLKEKNTRSVELLKEYLIKQVNYIS